jgi:hypothetical protein
MRTKTLLLAASLGVAGVGTAAAQDPVFSVNAVGYVNKTLTSGFNLISNPLNNGDNTLATVLTGLNPGTLVHLWNGSGFDVTTALPGNTFLPLNPAVNPGGGFFVEHSGADLTVTFVGEVPQGNLSNLIPAGLSIQSSQVPQAGDLFADLGLALNVGDLVQTHDGSSFSPSTFLPTGFTPPVNVEVGQAFFVQAASAVNWTRDFSVND